MSAYTNFEDMYRIHMVDGHVKIILLSDLEWRIGHITGPLYVVPNGFQFDVSIPWFFQWLFDPRDLNYAKGAALHDHMIHVSNWSRITAGAEFHNALKSSGVSRWKRLVMFLAVVLWKFS